MSTSKTENYQLHAWEAGDDFLRSEFNENFAAIDGILPLNRRVRVIVGSYQGNSISGKQSITLGFRPRVVLVSPKYGHNREHMAICVDGVEHIFSAVTEDGFVVENSLNLTPTYDTNNSYGANLNPYTYMAIGWEDPEE